MKAVYVIEALRTPVGRYGGTLAQVRPDDLAALVIKKLIEKHPQIDLSLIEDVVFGGANQAGEDNRNVARMAALMAGLPETVAGVTVNRLCASGLQSIMDASRAIMLGEGGIYLAGGVESMSRAPFVMAKPEAAFSRKTEMYDTTIGWRFINPALSEKHYPYTMGETAENVAEKWKISREAQDVFAHNSQLKYQNAHEKGKFNDELLAVEIKQRKGDSIIFDKDEHPRLSSPDKLATLKPAFKKGGSVTAGNSSGVNDGAAVLMLVNEDILKKFSLKPLARVVSFAVAGVAPDIMGIGPVPATEKALKRAGISKNDLGLVELNEAFAAQSIACIEEMDINPDIINVNGGSIAIGHPLGASGSRISSTLIHEMLKRPDVKYGLATMCVGVGQGAAVIYERV
ncbi:MAG: acetyl-CoA C-acyltransferase [Chitinophagaceae bacterium]|nr:MAG: acetyl-CoA C-acyltransferase [Chitinophagaceae bacterium]